MTEGERWALELLAELRAARFRPRAWARFLAAALERAALERRLHRRAHRQTLALTFTGLAAWAVPAVLGHAALGLAGAGWLVATMLMVDWHLGMLETPDGRPLGRLGLANTVTVARGAAVPILFAVDAGGLLVALALFGALDVVDGALARGLDERTRLGAWLEGSLDSLVAVAFAAAAARIGAIPAWLTALILARVAVPWLVVAWLYVLTPSPPQAAGAVRAPGYAARAPGVTAAIGLALALAGEDVGVPVAAIAAGVSIFPFALAVARSRAPAAAGAAPGPAAGALRSGSR
ncbi:CDP-alcohol phosphatidyltransferase [Gaiella occulta]|uniref:CDP-alcohol phosphatidyltransferase n=1 Tax=Gaiella occulta TaxID=1002870 RepID=A0A7M2YWR9_9ACTN|nr:CDP-alcohol phosphatidyltransferase family protein [Gaiella occulta]RDI74029.1 CDP-alcohol phosphatidyltransferase [Gaiella occulta]